MSDDQNSVEVQLQMVQAEPLDPLAVELDGDAVETTDLTISRPTAGETLTIATLGGMVYALELDPTQAQVLIESSDLILLFEDGGRIVFENLVGLARAGNSPSLDVDGTVISGDVLLGQALALAGADEALGDEPLTLETAAGGGAEDFSLSRLSANRAPSINFSVSSCKAAASFSLSSASWMVLANARPFMASVA